MSEDSFAHLTRDVPAGFQAISGVTGFAWIRDQWVNDLHELVLESGGITAALPVGDSYQGRGSTAIVDVNGAAFVVRRFLPGGLLRHFRSPIYSRPDRPFLELRLYEHLRRVDPGLTLEPIAHLLRPSRSGAGL